MSLALIEESAKEVRRLAIAGSPLAVGDFRLKKLVAPLEQAGAKVPVFAQVAKAINDVITGPEKESAARLLNLSTLLNAILYTQGQSGATGDFSELEVFATHCSSTRTTARLLKPLIEALTASGGGRLEVIKAAVERGAFNDLRLIDPAIQALGDSFPEIADLVAEKILPAYGPGIIPRLRSSLNLKGKKHDARKLTVMHQVNPAGTLELCQTALEDGSTEVKVAAVTCLGQHVECLPLVLEQAKAKNKDVRAAALEALAQHDLPDVTKLFNELIQGKSLEALVGPSHSLKNRAVLHSLLAEGRRVVDLIHHHESEQIPRCFDLLNCLTHKQEPEVETFLLDCFARSNALAKIKAAQPAPAKGPTTATAGLPNLAVIRALQNASLSGEDLVERLTVLLFQTGSVKAREAILAQRDTLPVGVFRQIVESALHTWPTEQVFTEFSPLLAQKKGKGKEKHAELLRILSDEDYAIPSAAEKIKWDPRWLDAAIQADVEEIIYHLARPHHAGVIQYLRQRLTANDGNIWFAKLAIESLARCQDPEVTDCFLQYAAKRMKSAKVSEYEMRELLASAKHLPPADLPKLDAFATTLDEKYVDRFLEAIAPLRPAATQPTPE